MGSVYSVPKNIDAKIKGNTRVKGVYRYRIPPIARVMYFYDAGVTLISPIEYTKVLARLAGAPLICTFSSLFST